MVSPPNVATMRAELSTTGALSAGSEKYISFFINTCHFSELSNISELSKIIFSELSSIKQKNQRRHFKCFDILNVDTKFLYKLWQSGIKFFVALFLYIFPFPPLYITVLESLPFRAIRVHFCMLWTKEMMS